MKKYYTTSPDGIPGNDDAGTMSAWAVFSMMGFYPDVPGVAEYTLTEPVFDKVTITLDPAYHGVDSLVIEKKNDGNKGITLGGKKIGHRVDHRKLLDGGVLTFHK